MSRTNPHQKKRRSVSRTLLMYGEGLGEEVFLKHLRKLYSVDSGIGVKIRNGKGGTPVNIVISAANEPGDFNRRVVIVDNDRGKQEISRARIEAKKRNVELLENSPCLEANLLLILRPGKSFSNKTSTWCKREFESNYLDKKKRTELDEYGKIFPKATLDAGRINVPELDKLIYLMKPNE